MHPFQKSPIILRSNLTDLCRPLGFLWGSCCFILGMSQKPLGTFQILSTFPEFVAHRYNFCIFSPPDRHKETHWWHFAILLAHQPHLHLEAGTPALLLFMLSLLKIEVWADFMPQCLSYLGLDKLLRRLYNLRADKRCTDVFHQHQH